MASADKEQAALQWQVGVWDRMSPIYLREVDDRFTEIIDSVIRRAALQRGQQVLDLGTGTGSVAVGAASAVMPGGGTVTGMDISPEMLRLARQRAASMGLSNITFLEGRAEEIPTPSGRFDAVLASLSLMYVIDRGAAAREITRVLRPGGRVVAAVWGGPEHADIVRSSRPPAALRQSRPCRASAPARSQMLRNSSLSSRAPVFVHLSRRRQPRSPSPTFPRRGMCLPGLLPPSYRPNGRKRRGLLYARRCGQRVMDPVASTT